MYREQFREKCHMGARVGKTPEAQFKHVRGGITAASGYVAAGVKAGVKASGEPDVALLVSEIPCAAAGAFTSNRVRASCVDWCESHLPSASIRAVFCNSGNANACTGKKGASDNESIARFVSESAGVDPGNVLTASTGVIGHTLPMDKVENGVRTAFTRLRSTNGKAFSQAILTTDTCIKEKALKCDIGDSSFTVGGTAKGSGMICPNMATMLAFVTSDVDVTPAALNPIVKRVVDRTFNNLTVDGDTSTNDMVLVLANGYSGTRLRGKDELSAFEEGLFRVCNDLCAKIAEDGEGATKRIEIEVTGGKTADDAQKVARSVANSNLVKTAVFGNDPNWGRILCAIGYSEARFSQKSLQVSLCGIPVCHGTTPVAFDSERMLRLLQKKVVKIDIDLGSGKQTAIAHTCDLTYDYIKINAEYHT